MFSLAERPELFFFFLGSFSRHSDDTTPPSQTLNVEEFGVLQSDRGAVFKVMEAHTDVVKQTQKHSSSCFLPNVKTDGHKEELSFPCVIITGWF